MVSVTPHDSKFVTLCLSRSYVIFLLWNKERKKERSFIFSTTAYVSIIMFKQSNKQDLEYYEMIQIHIHLLIQSDLGSKDAELRGTAIQDRAYGPDSHLGAPCSSSPQLQMSLVFLLVSWDIMYFLNLECKWGTIRGPDFYFP